VLVPNLGNLESPLEGFMPPLKTTLEGEASAYPIPAHALDSIA